MGFYVFFFYKGSKGTKRHGTWYKGYESRSHHEGGITTTRTRHS